MLITLSKYLLSYKMEQIFSNYVSSQADDVLHVGEICRFVQLTSRILFQVNKYLDVFFQHIYNFKFRNDFLMLDKAFLIKQLI